MSVAHGQRVIAGRYRLITVIGSGGAGVVWRARDDLLDRDVAVKEMARLAGADERTRSESYTRTLREARAAARISHPGVAAVYDVVSEDDYPYIVMELIGGRPLSGLLADERPLPPSAAADIGRQVLAALLAGHAAGVLHRDLKPANVLITPDGRAVLTDFGIASVVGDPSITRTGVVVGTPGYLAPERIKGEPATPAADLWSLGATLYAAACGRGPYDGYDGAIATMYAVVSEDPPEPTIGGPLRDIIDALLNRDPRLRPGPAEIALALDAAIGPSGTPGPHEQHTPYGESRWEHVASESAWEPVAGAPMSAPVAGAPVAGAPVAGPSLAGPSLAESSLPEPSLPEPPRTVTSDFPPVRTPTEAASLLLEPPADAGYVTATDHLPSGDLLADDDYGGAGAAQLPWSKRSKRSPRPVRRVRRGSGNRRRGVVVGAAAVAAGAAVAVVLTISLSHNKTPGAGNAANVTPPPVTEQFRVVAASNTDGSTELVARDQSGALMQDHLANGAWSGWIPLPGGLEFTGVPAVATGAQGRLVVFARTVGGNLVALWQQAPGSRLWNGPSRLSPTAITSDPTAVTWPDGHIQVFARLGDGTLGTATQRNAAKFADWSAWDRLGGRLGSAPVVALNSDGNPEVFAVGSDHTLVHDYWLNGAWAGVSALPGGKAFTGVPAVGRDQDGRLELFARTLSGAIQNVWQNSAGSGPWDGPAAIPISSPISDPAVMSVNGGRLELFAVVANGTMEHTWQKAPNGTTGWNTPASLRGNAVDAPAVIRVSGISELFAKGPDGKIGYDHLDHPVGAWSGWSGLAGTF
ncbi:MAG TPA: protein kinase [Streptosporangiaceae bacterium]